MLAQKTSLLVVAHDAYLRLALSIVFGSAGCRVRVAQDGYSALSEMHYEAADIVVADLDMPRRAGFELLTLVGKMYPAARVIAISGRLASQSIPPGVHADAFHGKGTHPGALIDLVKMMSSHVQARRQRQAQSLVPAQAQGPCRTKSSSRKAAFGWARETAVAMVS